LSEPTDEADMTDVIFTATTATDYVAFSELVREYVEWCRGRYYNDAWFIDQVFNHQSLDRELQALTAIYGPPKGRTLLATRDGQICGGVAYHRLSDGICEMKRLFVPSRFQGQGTGRRLCEAAVASAKDDGFQLMRLDTANLMTEAIAMYQSIGFRHCAPYQDYPEKLMPFLVFMEMPLTESGTATECAAIWS
jgi:ribosomal protein S18 acetylase RimI-like enzyme